MIIYFENEPTQTLLSPYKNCQYKVMVDVPFSNAIRFKVEIYKGSETEPSVSFDSIGKAEGLNTSFQFNLKRVIVHLVGPANQINYFQNTPFIDYEAVQSFHVKVIVTNLSDNDTAEIDSQTKYIWQGKTDKSNQRLLLSANKKIAEKGKKTFFSYLFFSENGNEKSIVVSNTTTTTELFNINIQNPCIITFPILVSENATISIKEIEGLAIFNEEKIELISVDDCNESIVFFNSYGGWETFLFKTISQSEGKIESEEISNKTLVDLPNTRTKTTIFREITEVYKAHSRSIQDFEKNTLKDFFESKDVYLIKDFTFLPIVIAGDTYILFMKRKLLFLAFTFVFATACKEKFLENIFVPKPIITCVKASNNKVSVEYQSGGYADNDTIVCTLRNISTGEVTTISQLRGSGQREILFDDELNNGTLSTNVLVELYAKRNTITSEVDRKEIELANYISVPFPTQFTITSIGTNVGGVWLSLNWDMFAPCLALPNDYLSAKIQVWRFGFPNRTYKFLNTTDSYPYPMGERQQGSISTRNIVLDTGEPAFTIQNGDEIRLLVKTTRNDRASQASDWQYVNQNTFIVSGL